MEQKDTQPSHDEDRAVKGAIVGAEQLPDPDVHLSEEEKVAAVSYTL
jgi:hypothetical protein